MLLGVMSAPQVTQCLFVYGTLKRGFSNPWSRRLWSHARFAGEASLPGRLYDLGPFPAFVEDASSGTLVHGEVAELSDPGLLAQLDHYEGAQYARLLRRVRMHGGGEREAWVYVWHAPLANARFIPGGRWPVE